MTSRFSILFLLVSSLGAQVKPGDCTAGPGWQQKTCIKDESQVKSTAPTYTEDPVTRTTPHCAKGYHVVEGPIYLSSIVVDGKQSSGRNDICEKDAVKAEPQKPVTPAPQKGHPAPSEKHAPFYPSPYIHSENSDSAPVAGIDAKPKSHYLDSTLMEIASHCFDYTTYCYSEYVWYAGELARQKAELLKTISELNARLEQDEKYLPRNGHNCICKENKVCDGGDFSSDPNIVCPWDKKIMADKSHSASTITRLEKQQRSHSASTSERGKK